MEIIVNKNVKLLLVIFNLIFLGACIGFIFGCIFELNNVGSFLEASKCIKI